MAYPVNDKDIKMAAICIDHQGTWSYVKPVISGKAWEFDVYIDSEGDFQRAMGVIEAPYTMLFNKDHEIICRYPGYCSGNEEMVCKKILSCLSEADELMNQKKELKIE